MIITLSAATAAAAIPRRLSNGAADADGNGRNDAATATDGIRWNAAYAARRIPATAGIILVFE